MTIQKMNCVLIAVLLLFSFACVISASPPQADPNAFNTMIAQTAQVQLLPPAQPLQPIQPTVAAPPTAILPTAIPPTQGPAMLVSATVSLPRQMALDLETQTISGPHNTGNNEHYLNTNALPNMDLLFYAPKVDNWQFLIPLNNSRMALPSQTQNQASYQGCVDAFNLGQIYGKGRELGAFPLDSSTFRKPAVYICFVTDKGKLGTLTIPEDYAGIPAVSITYTIWDAALP